MAMITRAMIPELNVALEKFLASDDFKSGVISSAKADWGTPSRGGSVVLFPGETYQVLKNNQIDNFDETLSITLSLLDADDHIEYFGGASGSDEDYLSTRLELAADEDALDAFLLKKFDQSAEELKKDLRNKLEVITSIYDFAEK